ncbi:hypothetical protein FDP22_16690 [Paroceanicella profunda]|uniref:Uncharacterized protein n=1 Tax=Paroceanicella profunda TaxID=2579971 RepID=A0A5B8FXZ1_9RHOB|nr:hypothetical protein FDP22_16690 [Paroceanicella profunda]
MLRAARAGLGAYARDIHLARILPGTDPARDPKATLRRLREMEAACDAARRARETGYSPSSHVSVLVALLAELRRVQGRTA